MRAPSTTDFTIPLPKFGDFVFARRTMGDMIKIRSIISKLMGDDSDDEMMLLCEFSATYSTLIVSCPVGWEDILSLDVNAVGFNNVIALENMLSEKESSFRTVAIS
jgi:hypothetical protein